MKLIYVITVMNSREMDSAASFILFVSDSQCVSLDMQ